MVFAVIIVERTPAVLRVGCHGFLIDQTALHLKRLRVWLKKRRKQNKNEVVAVGVYFSCLYRNPK